MAFEKSRHPVIIGIEEGDQMTWSTFKGKAKGLELSNILVERQP